MVQSVVEGGGDLSSGRDADGVGTGVELVAADVVRGHVADEAVVLPVVGLADSGPVCGTVDARECVCWSRVSMKEACTVVAPEYEVGD